MKAKGFSLVELLIALFLSVFLIGGATLMYLSGSATSRDTRELSRIQENLRFASDFLIRDIRNAGFFDDELAEFEEITTIRSDFAAIGDNGGSLRISYLGLGSCDEQFQEIQRVDNTFRVSDGSLTCNGVALATGIDSVEFEFIYPDGSAGTSCNFDFTESNTASLRTACIGVVVRLNFQNLGGVNRVELQAAFRNVILARMGWLDDLEV